MKKTLFLAISILFFNLSANSATFQGNVSKVDQIGSHQIVDADSMNPIDGATINIPQKNFSTKSDANGKFSLDANISGDTIMSVSKDGYKPFSLTVNESIASRPMTVGIEKTAPMDLTVDTNMFHLGDNNFSDTSANAGEFRVQSIGPYYTKKVLIKDANDSTYLVVGSIIGCMLLLSFPSSVFEKAVPFFIAFSGITIIVSGKHHSLNTKKQPT